jgi:nicotinamidase/pyrazinamidase
MKRNFQLLIIDPQNDFCDLPDDYLSKEVRGTEDLGNWGPALPVNGAHADMLRLSEAVLTGAAGISAITVTLDSHHHVGIERPAFWIRSDGSDVAPFTEITQTDILAGSIKPRDERSTPRVLGYLDALEARGRYRLMVWPTHCEIGTWGHNVHRDLRHAYNRWEENQTAQVYKVIKGTNPWTEHYSALVSEVPDLADPATQMNHHLLKRLSSAEQLFVGGEAGSHCVRATVEDFIATLPDEQKKRIVLLTDCMSCVSGFDEQYRRFLEKMGSFGVQLATSSDLRQELLANA